MIMLGCFSEVLYKPCPLQGDRNHPEIASKSQRLKGVLNIFKSIVLEIKVFLIEEGHSSQTSVFLDGVELFFSQFCLIFYISIIQLSSCIQAQPFFSFLGTLKSLGWVYPYHREVGPTSSISHKRNLSVSAAKETLGEQCICNNGILWADRELYIVATFSPSAKSSVTKYYSLQLIVTIILKSSLSLSTHLSFKNSPRKA